MGIRPAPLLVRSYSYVLWLGEPILHSLQNRTQTGPWIFLTLSSRTVWKAVFSVSARVPPAHLACRTRHHSFAHGDRAQGLVCHPPLEQSAA